MKTIGLIGGMSWESTELYHRILNEGIKHQLGGHHSAKIAMVSVDFQELVDALGEGDWNRIAVILTRAAQRVEAAGADFILIATNTMHKVAPEIEAAVTIPLLHIIDTTAEACRATRCTTVGVLGTRFTMQEPFYRQRLEQNGLTVLLPPDDEHALIDRIIFEELVLGKTTETSRRQYLRIINDLVARGAQGLIAGCTEIGLLVEPQHIDCPLFDTAKIHAEAAVKTALA